MSSTNECNDNDDQKMEELELGAEIHPADSDSDSDMEHEHEHDLHEHDLHDHDLHDHDLHDIDESSLDALFWPSTPSGANANQTRARAFKLSPGSKSYIMNAVHMEVQENAKIPNSYHIPVRRSAEHNHNHGHNHGHNHEPRSGSNFIDEMMRLSEADLALTENFLGSDHRMSKAAAYCNAGLLSSIGTKVDAIAMNSCVDYHDHDHDKDNSYQGKNNGNERSELNANANANANANVDALKVGKAASGMGKTLLSNTTGGTGTCTNTTSTSATASTGTSTPTSTEVAASVSASGSTMRVQVRVPISLNAHTTRAYGRPVPLPIPTRGKFSPQHQNQSQSTSSRPITMPPARTSTEPILPQTPILNRTLQPQPQSQLKPVPSTQSQAQKLQSQHATSHIRSHATIVQRTPTVTSIPNAPGQPSIPLSALPPLYAAPSILEATKMRSQFGFGGNHKVPSIPHPPQPKGTGIGTGAVKMLPIIHSAAPGKKPDTSSLSSVTVEVASYERKKQRAKDARIKLNESIERLSVAINVAGSQAKERIKTQRGSLNPAKGGGSSAVSKGVGGTGLGSGIVVVNGVLSIMEQVSSTADSAKKWDRPSFVGTAANMVQNLNAECEALMREVVKLKKERLQWMDPNNGNCLCGKRKIAIGQDAVSNSISDSGSFDDADKLVQQDGNARKKRKAVELEEITFVHDIFQFERITNTIGKFLDPRSLIRATSVSTSWQFQLSCFWSDIIWSPLCYSRFGSVQVRDWQEQLSEVELSQQHHPKTIMMHLYKTMNAANVKPKCHYEGSLHLGGGRINNIVSAWASVVERSNGETRRSVMTVGNSGEVKYSSLPVVELRILIQNTGMIDGVVCIPEQIISIDASTKRSRGVEMFEITSDGRFKKNLLNIDGTLRHTSSKTGNGINSLACLGLFDSLLMCTYIHATSCPTISKVKSKAKYVKILVNVRGATLPLVIPICD